MKRLFAQENEVSKMTTTQELSFQGTRGVNSLQANGGVQTGRRPDDRNKSAYLTPLARPEYLPENVWPFQTVGLEVDGSMVAVTDIGRGPTLLFVHTGTWSFIWRDVMTRLASGFRCICMDAPGTGLSAQLPKWAITLDRSSRAVADVIERFNLEDLTLVVHDLGGVAGVAGAARTPDRVRGLVAINTFGWRPSGPAFRGMLALMGSALMREIDVATEFLPRIASSAFGVGRHLDEPSRRAYHAGMKGQRLRAFHNYLNSARHSDALYDQVESALSGVFRELPLLTIFGERNDPLGFQPRWKALFPDALQVIVAKGNHYPMCDDPDLVARTIHSWHRERIAPNIS
jgi:pimeloyl-ACP methyl ester carboxylesterase